MHGLTFVGIKKGLALAATSTMLLSSASAFAYTEPGLILWDDFSKVSSFSRQDGYHSFTFRPRLGPTATVRYWQPGVWGNGAPGSSRLQITSTYGYRGSPAVSFNYSGSDNGYTTMDELDYPVGERISLQQGTIEFLYKPRYDNTDSSALMSILGFKARLDHPYSVYDEIVWDGVPHMDLHYYGWGGRKYFLVRLDDAGGPTIEFATPPEGSATQVKFAKNRWMHMAVTWNMDGIPNRGNETMALFVNGAEVASTTRALPAKSLEKYLILGSMPGCVFVQNSPAKCYSGGSGIFDDLKVWSVSKTRFCRPWGSPGSAPVCP